MADAAAETAPCFLDLQWNGYWGEKPTGTACSEPSSATVSLSCVHGHLDKGRICSGCAAEIQQAAGTITCPRCWNAALRHACYFRVVIGWDSGEKTTVQGRSCG